MARTRACSVRPEFQQSSVAGRRAAATRMQRQHSVHRKHPAEPSCTGISISMKGSAGKPGTPSCMPPSAGWRPSFPHSPAGTAAAGAPSGLLVGRFFSHHGWLVTNLDPADWVGPAVRRKAGPVERGWCVRVFPFPRPVPLTRSAGATAHLRYPLAPGSQHSSCKQTSRAIKTFQASGVAGGQGPARCCAVAARGS